MEILLSVITWAQSSEPKEFVYVGTKQNIYNVCRLTINNSPEVKHAYFLTGALNVCLIFIIKLKKCMLLCVEKCQYV